jgi:hypothetical protein
MQATVGKFWTLSSQCWLEDNPQFCSSDHRKEWINEIEEPKTTVGVLGNAGVGKESVELYKSHGLVDWTLFCRFDLLLLVVILAECTSRWSGSASHVRFAWVYCCSRELRFIIDMVEAKEVKEVKDTVSVYCGEVQFITWQEWATELKVLVDECSSEKIKILVLELDNLQPDP